MATLPTTITDVGFTAYLGGVYPTPATALTGEDGATTRARVLTTAYSQLAARYDLGAADTEDVQEATYAQALFIYVGGSAMQQRTNLRAQSVTAAGIVKESYAGADMAICPEAKVILAACDNMAAVAGLVQQDREMYDE